MICQECGEKEATIHIVKNINGRQTELNLCEQCARKKDELDFTFQPQFSLHKLFSSMLEQSLRDKREAAAITNSQCPRCGLTFSQFSQVGRLGCSECFSAFEGRLKPLLKRIHAGETHSGKIPIGVKHRVQAFREIEKFKEELKQKIADEDFEKAAELRDHIRELEKEAALGLNEIDGNPGEDEPREGNE